MNPWSQDYLCAKCGERFNKIVEKSERHSPVPCEAEGCDGAAGPTWSVPKNLRASYPDGTVRPGLRRLAEAANLEAESYSLPVSERGEHQKEIARLRKADTK